MSQFVDQQLNSHRKNIYEALRPALVFYEKLSSTDRVVLTLGKVVELSTYDKQPEDEYQ